MRNSSKITLAIILIILINISLYAIFVRDIITDKQNSAPLTYSLGEITEVGYAGFKIEYDNEPIDVILISPSGKQLSKDYLDIYTVDEEHKTITGCEDTTELGEWKIRFGKGSNKVIKYKSVNTPSTTIHLTAVQVLEIENEPYISFKPIMDNSYSKTCKYAISLKNKEHSFSLESGETLLNEIAYVKIDPNINAFNGENYTLTISVVGQIADGKDSKASDNINVLLPAKPKPIYRPLGIQNSDEGDNDE